jgi:hypothetical protein
MKKRVTKTIFKSLLLLTAGLWTPQINAQWSGLSPAPCLLNPVNNDQDAGININTATGRPEGKLHIHQWADYSDFGANKKHLVLGLAFDMLSNPFESVWANQPSASSTNDYSIEPNVGQDLQIYKLESSAISMNAKGPIVSYSGNKSLVVSFNPSTTSFSSGISTAGNLNVTGVSTLQNTTASDLTTQNLTVSNGANISDLTTQSLTVNNSADFYSTTNFNGVAHFKHYIGGNEVKILGKVAIGGGKTTNTFVKSSGNFSDWALSVDGNIVSRKAIVQITSWADKVFQKNYKLMSLSEIEAFVSKYKHLPEIPSEAEVLENGVDVGEMNKLLLQKVEELTLHLIDLDKKYKSLEAQVKKTGK